MFGNCSVRTGFTRAIDAREIGKRVTVKKVYDDSGYCPVAKKKTRNLVQAFVIALCTEM